MPVFVDVDVLPHPALPAGCVARWKAAGGREPVAQVWYDPDEGPEGDYDVEAAWSDGRHTPAQQLRIEDSAAGVSLLVVGGDFGLRLRLGSGPAYAEPYLIVAPDS